MKFGLFYWQYILIAIISANIIFLGVGGSVHYFFYHKNRNKSEQWKMQPNRFLSDRLAKHAAMLGTINMNIAAGIFGFLAWGIFEKNWSQLYYNFSDYDYGWAILSVCISFIFIETCAYYMHAATHQPWLYKKIHHIHHYYNTPTFFTISAMHPLEWLAHASYIIMPAFIWPMHISLYLFVMLTTFYYGYWDHSGIKLKHNLPFHGSNKFHDDHHKYFHVNYGFLTPLFDRIHNTVRREFHHYTEDTFTKGKGRVKTKELGKKAIGPWINYSKRWQ